MYSFNDIEHDLQKHNSDPKIWLVTGCAGFIGSNIVEKLLQMNQVVIGVDNLSTGKLSNLDMVKARVSTQQWDCFYFREADIVESQQYKDLFENNKIDYVLHQAAISSVIYSIEHPDEIKKNNIDGFRAILDLATEFKIKVLAYASSSSVYGDNLDTRKIESNTGNLLSPYAQSKFMNEQMAKEYSDKFGITTIGLRYFNVFGKRQDPNGTYAAVIPKWILAVLNNSQIYINGDGTTTRDFLSVDDVVMSNILACLNGTNPKYNLAQIYNIGSGESVSLNDLYYIITKIAEEKNHKYILKPQYRDFIDGDIRHSCANIELAQDNLNFRPSKNLELGIRSLVTEFTA